MAAWCSSESRRLEDLPDYCVDVQDCIDVDFCGDNGEGCPMCVNNRCECNCDALQMPLLVPNRD